MSQEPDEKKTPLGILDLLDDTDRGFRLVGARGDGGFYREFDWPATRQGWETGMASVADIDVGQVSVGCYPGFYGSVNLVAPRAAYLAQGVRGPTVASFDVDGQGGLTPWAGHVRWDLSLGVAIEPEGAKVLELPPESVRWLLGAMCRTLTIGAVQIEDKGWDHGDAELKRLVYDTYWPGTFDPDSNPTTPPDWWIVRRVHWEEALVQLGRCADRVIEASDEVPYSAARVKSAAENYWLQLGRVHGILGRLPVGFLRYPEDLDRRMNAAGARAMRLVNA